jgi:hypothetical protein
MDQMRHMLAEERDRRYAEVNVEREKALKIKEEADRTALQLARENQNLKDENQKQVQQYKDEKANELRSQIERERGEYPTRTELTAAMDRFSSELKSMGNSVNELRQAGSLVKGKSEGVSISTGVMVTVITLGIAAFGLIIALVR